MIQLRPALAGQHAAPVVLEDRVRAINRDGDRSERCRRHQRGLRSVRDRGEVVHPRDRAVLRGCPAGLEVVHRVVVVALGVDASIRENILVGLDHVPAFAARVAEVGRALDELLLRERPQRARREVVVPLERAGRGESPARAARPLATIVVRVSQLW